MKSWLFGLVSVVACEGGISGAGISGVLDGPNFGPQRKDWVLSEIARENQSLSEALQQEKLTALAASPYSFYRGTNHLFWSDFAQHPMLSLYGNDETITWLQGDLHTNNLGAFSNDQGQVVYDLNDFDESLVADFQLDLWRMATSIVLLAQSQNISEKSTKDAVDAFTESYLDAMNDFHGSNAELAFQLREDNTYGPLDNFLRDTLDSSRKALLEKWTNVDNNQRVFDLTRTDLAPIEPNLLDEVVLALPSYGATLSGNIAFDKDFFTIKDAARRLHAGVGSLGQDRFYLLFEGPTASLDDDILVDVKHQPGPTGLRYLSIALQERLNAAFPNAAARSIAGQRALGYHVDDLSGWLSISTGDFALRELSPFKESLAATEINSSDKLRQMSEQWGLIIAAAHARSDKDGSDLITNSVDSAIDEATNGDHKSFRALVRSVAFVYAQQVNDDYQSFLSRP